MKPVAGTGLVQGNPYIYPQTPLVEMADHRRALEVSGT